MSRETRVKKDGLVGRSYMSGVKTRVQGLMCLKNLHTFERRIFGDFYIRIRYVHGVRSHPRNSDNELRKEEWDVEITQPRNVNNEVPNFYNVEVRSTSIFPSLPVDGHIDGKLVLRLRKGFTGESWFGWRCMESIRFLCSALENRSFLWLFTNLKD